jgi:molecular chaperone DnaK
LQEPPESRRKFARIALETNVRIVLSGVDARRRMFVDNVSEGGLFIRTRHPKPIGTQVRFEFLVRDDGPKVCGKGIVQWVNSGEEGAPGMGIRFVELNDSGRQELLAALRERKKRGVT